MNKKIKIDLLRFRFRNSQHASVEYKVLKIAGAVVVHTLLEDIRAGDPLNEKQAVQLSEAYNVTVTPYTP